MKRKFMIYFLFNVRTLSLLMLKRDLIDKNQNVCKQGTLSLWRTGRAST